MPTSQRPRRAYAGPRSVRDLERRPSFLTQLMEEAANPRPPAPPKRALSRGRVAAIGAGAAAAGGGAYALHRRRRGVRKVDEFSKTTRSQRLVYDDRLDLASNGEEGRANRREYRRRNNFKHQAPGLGIGGAVGAGLGAAAVRPRGLGALFGGVNGAAVGSIVQSQRARSSVQRDLDKGKKFSKGDGMILVDPFSGGLLEVSKSYPIAVPVQSSTPVTPRTPSGPHVSHENRLRRFKNTPTNPHDSRVQQFHSGTMTEKELKGGGRSFGSRARRVKKNFEGHQPIVGGMAERGSRGTPLSELGRHNRVGHKLPV